MMHRPTTDEQEQEENETEGSIMNNS